MIWEQLAVGLQLGHARSLGQWDAQHTLRWHGGELADGLSLFQPWAIVRLHERLQAQAWLPLLLNDRRAGGESQLAGGLGDVGLGALRGSGTTLTLIDPRGVPVAVGELIRERTATLFVFWSGSCPCVRRYQQRVEALLERYPAARVRVVGVVSNAGETLADARRVAAERGVRLSLYGDPEGRLAQAIGARSTPTVVVLDPRGRVRFLGWIDNERAAGERGREPWLDRALEAMLAGHDRFAARTPTYGCVITRSLFGDEAQRCCTAPP